MRSSKSCSSCSIRSMVPDDLIQERVHLPDVIALEGTAEFSIDDLLNLHGFAPFVNKMGGCPFAASRLCRRLHHVRIIGGFIVADDVVVGGRNHENTPGDLVDAAV